MSAEEVVKAIGDLANPDDFVKLEAENTIAMSIPEQLDTIHEEIVKKEYPKQIKTSLIEILQSVKDESSIEVFAQLLHDQNKWVRRASSSALADYGDVAIPTLLELAEDKSWRARGGAVWALAKIGNPDTVDVFIKAAKDEKSFVRSGSVFGLGSIGTPDAKAALEELVENDKSGYVKYNAKEFLAKFEEEDDEQ